jgi:hypothetical protein
VAAVHVRGTLVQEQYSAGQKGSRIQQNIKRDVSFRPYRKPQLAVKDAV